MKREPENIDREKDIEETKPNVVEIREIIKNNILTMIVTIVVSILVVMLFQFDILNSVWELSYDMDFYYYLDQNANIYVRLISGGLEVGLALMIIQAIRMIRFAILLIYSLSLIITVVFFITSFLIQTKFKFKYLIISNIIILIVSLTVGYYSLPSISAVIVEIGTFVEEISNFTVNDIMNPLGLLEPLFTVLRFFYIPIIINLVFLLIISISTHIIFRYVGAKQIRK